MKKVRITESQLRGLVKRMIRENSAPEKYVYATDNMGKIDLKKMVGTHQYGKGFTPNQLGIKMGFKPNPTSIPNGTRMDDSSMQGSSMQSLSGGLVKRMIKEEIGMDLKVGDKVMFDNDEQQYKITRIISPTQIEFIDNVNNKKYSFNPQKQKYEKIGTELSESQLRGLVKRMIKEEVKVTRGYNYYNNRGQVESTDSDIMLAKRLEQYLGGGVSIEIKPDFKDTVGSTPDNIKGRKYLNFKIYIGTEEKSDNLRQPKDRNYHVSMFLRRLEASKKLKMIEKFFSAKPNNYELISHDGYSEWMTDYSWFAKLVKPDKDVFMTFTVMSSFMERDKPNLEKDIYSEPMGKRRSQGGF